MKRLVKKCCGIAKILPIQGLRRGYILYRKRYPWSGRLETILKANIILPNEKLDYKDDYVRQFKKVCGCIQCLKTEHFIYPFDGRVVRVSQSRVFNLSSMTVDFGEVLNSSVDSLRFRLAKCKDEGFRVRQQKVVDIIEDFAKKIDAKYKTSLSKILNGKPTSLEDAIQKILFYNGLFWQMSHTHIGLGRLDLILEPYFSQDINKGKLSEKEAKSLLLEFICILGKQTAEKSQTLKGDTGQYILLGGINKENVNVDNVLTGIFLDLFAEINVPDPKLILRVNQNTSHAIWNKAIKCITKGTGSPLIMNEKPIMDNMVEFGYSKEDVWNMGTSACWEPLIIGKSFDQNNPFRSAVSLKALNEVICTSSNEYASFEELMAAFKRAFKTELQSVVTDKDFDCSPLFTLFYDDCIKREKDFTEGGAIYSCHGAQVVSLPNTVNALLNIKELVFDKKLITLADCRKAIEVDFNQMDDIRQLLLSSANKYGAAKKEVVDLTNEIMNYAGNVIAHMTCNGEKLKVGFSSPNYVSYAKSFPASLDGRRAGDPFAVHISPMSSNIDISEILDFSTMLNYEDNRINGNVVDFIIPSSYINNQDKLVSLLKDACARGLFELQLNVMDKATLIDAKAHPEKYPNLIVRVWGFSAYFNDLPEDFKDNLIQRAELYETA